MFLKRLAFVLLALFIGCAPQLESFPSLVNQGILPLSNTNAYLGSNLFLAREFSESRYLFNFFQNRGAPTAIEVLQEGSTSPARILMFYPKDKEVYVAQLQVDRTSHFYEWVTRGPFPIEREDYRRLMRLDTAAIGEPVFNYQGRQFRFKFSPEKVTSPVLPPIPTATPKPRKVIKRPVLTKPIEQPTPTPFRPLNSDQQAIQMSMGYAERAPNGDVVHSVKADGETLDKIAGWYTGSPAAASEIQGYNNLENSPLKAGAKVRIPMRLVKEFKAMP